MIVATYRADELDANVPLFEAVGRLQRCRNVHDIRLASFTRVELGELVASALGADRTLSPGTLEDVLVRCDGNPFYAEEPLKSAVARDECDRGKLPISIRASILERLQLLDESEREIVAYAAAFGYRFDMGSLGALTGRPSDEVARTLRRARNLNVVVADGETGRFRFRHGLTRQAIYEHVLDADTTTLHARVLALLESTPGAERDFEELAYHAVRAGDRAKSRAYNERAGERALELRAFADAIACFERALDAALDEQERAHVLERLGYAAEFAGRYAVAIEHYQRALEVRLRRNECDDACRIFTRQIGCRSNNGDEAALDDVDPFVERYGDRASLAASGAVLAFAARMSSAIAVSERTWRFLARIGDPEALPPRARSNFYMAQVNLAADDFDIEGWKRAAYRVEQTASELPLELAAGALCTIAQTALFLGLNDRVERALERANAFVREGGSLGIATFWEAIAAVAALTRGRLANAETHLRAVHARPEIFVAQTLAAQAAPIVALHLGRDDLTSPAADRVIRSAREGTVYADEALVLAARAEWLAAVGRSSEARSMIVAAMTASGDPHPQMDLVFVSAAAHGDVGNFDGLLALVAQREPCAAPLRAAHVSLVRAIVASRRDQPIEALGHATAAAELYRRCGWPLWEARALLLAGRNDEAGELFERCGSLLGRSATPPVPDAAQFAAGLLSPRERDVALLVSEGFTNAAIGVRLGVSAKTVEKHVAAIFAKLDVRSRAQIAVAVSRSGFSDYIVGAS